MTSAESKIEVAIKSALRSLISIAATLGFMGVAHVLQNWQDVLSARGLGAILIGMLVKGVSAYLSARSISLLP